MGFVMTQINDEYYYNIAKEFISNKNSVIVTENAKTLDTEYIVINSQIGTQLYVLTIHVPYGRALWRDLAHDPKYYLKLSKKRLECIDKKRGTVKLTCDDNTVFQTETAHSIGWISMLNQSEIMRKIGKSMSPQFFGLTRIADKIMDGKFKPVDNTEKLKRLINDAKYKTFCTKNK